MPEAEDPATSIAPPGGLPGGAGSSGSTGGATPLVAPPRRPGVVPPMSGPMAQAVPPRGNMELGRQKMGLLMSGMLNALQDFEVGGEDFNEILSTIQRLSKRFRVERPQGPGPMAAAPQNQMGGMGQAPGMAPGGNPGGALGAMTPRGPVPGVPRT